MKPKVSIIVPVYHAELYLEQCVDSLRRQTMQEIEIILIDDGSPDDCPEMCDRFACEDGRIRVFHQENAGVSAARNRGIDAALADWLMFVDPDDWLEPNAVEVLYHRAMMENCDIVCTPFYVNYPNKETVRLVNCGENGIYFTKGNLNFLLDRSIRRIPGTFGLRSPCGKIYRTNRIIDNQCCFPIGLKHREDIVFNLYANFYAEKICILKDPIYHYRQRSESATRMLHDDELKIHRRYGREVRRFMEKFRLMDEYGAYYEYAVLEGVFSVARLYAVNIGNRKTMREAVSILKRFSEESECARAIKTVKMLFVAQRMKRCALWLLKRRMYRAVILAAYVYQAGRNLWKPRLYG